MDTIQSHAQQSKFRYFRTRIFYSVYIGNAFYYINRKSLSYALPNLLASQSTIDKATAGMLSSLFSCTYGVSKLISGVLADRYSPRLIMPLGLLVSALLNVVFSFCTSLEWFSILWAMNGAFSALGWAPCARLLTHWFSKKERGTVWGLATTSQTVGGAVIALVGTSLATNYGWRWAMLIPGIFGLLVAVMLAERLRDTPQTLGLPTVEELDGAQFGTKSFTSNTASQSSDDKTKDGELMDEVTDDRQLLWEYVLTNPAIWLVGTGFCCLYAIRTAITDWVILFLVEQKSYSAVVAGGILFWFDVGGSIGSSLGGVVSDKVFGGQRAPPLVVLLSLLAVTLGCMRYLSGVAVYFVDAALLTILGAIIMASQVLLGVAAAESSHKRTVSTSDGLVGLLAYAGATAAGFPLGIVAETYGWDAFFTSMAIIAIAGVAVIVPLLIIKKRVKAE